MRRLSFLVAMLLVVVFPASIVSAQTSTAGTDLKTRIEERKTRLKTKLDAAGSQRISGKCVAAQARLKEVSTKLKQSNEKYLPKYDEFLQKVEKQEAELADAGIKSSELLNQIGEARKKYEMVKTLSSKLQTSLDDAANIDCKADPVGFKATVDDARADAKSLTEAQQDLTKYVRTTLKQTLNTVKVN